jgi:hypothetical protein
MNVTYPALRRHSLAILPWALLISGLTVHAFAPRLKIEHRAFVIPKALVSQGTPIRPAEIVERERIMQVLSALLMAAGALGLALRHRNMFVRGARAGEQFRGGLPRPPTTAAHRRAVSER